MFGFQKLDVYQCATQFLARSAPLAERAPRGYAALANQLRRAALSIPLNIAEGSGKFDNDARRFYAIARGSALESAAVLDAFESLNVASAAELTEARDLLDRIVAMLTVLLRA
jgi:four helix bundle protein